MSNDLIKKLAQSPFRNGITQSGDNFIRVTDQKIRSRVAKLIADSGVSATRISADSWVVADGEDFDDEEPFDVKVAECDLNDKIAKWKSIVTQSGEFSGFRKASHTLPLSMNPQAAAAKLSRMADRMAKQHKSKKFAKLAKILAEASKSPEASRKAIKALSRTADPTTTVKDTKQSQQYKQLVESCEDYIRNKMFSMGYQGDSLWLYFDESQEQFKKEWLGVAKNQQSWDVTEKFLTEAWTEAIQNLKNREKVTANRKSPYYNGSESGMDDLLYEGQVDDLMGIFASRDDMDEVTGSKLSNKKCLVAVEKTIEHYAGEKHPAKITKEDTARFIKQAKPKYFKFVDQIQGGIEKLTHRPERHKEKKSSLARILGKALGSRIACGCGGAEKQLSMGPIGLPQFADIIMSMIPSPHLKVLPDSFFKDLVEYISSKEKWKDVEDPEMKIKESFHVSEPIEASKVVHMEPMLATASCSDCKGSGMVRTGSCLACRGRGKIKKMKHKRQPILSTEKIVLDVDYAKTPKKR